MRRRAGWFGPEGKIVIGDQVGFSGQINISYAKSRDTYTAPWERRHMFVRTFDWKLKRRRKSRLRKLDGYVYMSDTILDSFYGKSGPITDVKIEKASVHPMKPHTRGQVDALAVSQRLMPHRQSRSTVNPKYDPSNFYLGDCKDDSGLYDVTLEVNTSYQP
ncbi:unnamed protein product [Fraxinus pennsylvanica]|uniref:Uncharacterized protein n=1 Tax=Fraxinus pennsylvanica TaxID=56036 RepID=A0AAD2DSG4_9LAMI|nr:unnamed protein product [Fraxinus pennsylvanica]